MGCGTCCATGFGARCRSPAGLVLPVGCGNYFVAGFGVRCLSYAGLDVLFLCGALCVRSKCSTGFIAGACVDFGARSAGSRRASECISVACLREWGVSTRGNAASVCCDFSGSIVSSVRGGYIGAVESAFCESA